ncbi:MAG: HDIG domain-containing protein [Bacteroidales bacterium]|nr:HDIG domain-containing protein [Candidatus Scybalousia scybalohippi]
MKDLKQLANDINNIKKSNPKKYSEYLSSLVQSSNSGNKEATYLLNEIGANAARERRGYEGLKSATYGAAMSPLLPLSMGAYGALPSGAKTIVDGLFAINGINNLTSEEGVKKTIQNIKNKNYQEAAISGLGDLVDASMVGPTAIKGIQAVKKGYDTTVPTLKTIIVSQKIGKKHPKIVNTFIEQNGDVNWDRFNRFQKVFWKNVGTKEHLGTRPENPKWHKVDKNTMDHTKMVVNNANLEPIEKQDELIKAALFHDFTKPLHNAMGIDHSQTSALVAKKLGISDNISNAIKRHMDFVDKLPEFDNTVKTSLMRADRNFDNSVVPIYRAEIVANTGKSNHKGYLNKWWTTDATNATGYFNNRVIKNPGQVIKSKVAYIPESKILEFQANKVMNEGKLPKEQMWYSEDELVLPTDNFQSLKERVFKTNDIKDFKKSTDLF